VFLVGWFLRIFGEMGIGVSSRVVATNICKIRMVPTNNYKNYFCGFLSKGFPRKSCVLCFAPDICYK